MKRPLVHLKISKDMAVFLANICMRTFNQFENNGVFDLPVGYRLVTGFKAITEWFGFIVESDSNIVVAFRGSASAPDFIADASALQVEYNFIPLAGKTHAGFTLIYSSFRDQIISELQKLPYSKNIFITGHSLGGALAVLNAADIAVNTGFKQPVMCNFGGPRTGDPVFAKEYEKLVKASVRYVNLYDIVPLLPPPKITLPLMQEPLYYRHVKRGLYLFAKAGGIKENHALETYIEAILNSL